MSHLEWAQSVALIVLLAGHLFQLRINNLNQRAWDANVRAWEEHMKHRHPWEKE